MTQPGISNAGNQSFLASSARRSASVTVATICAESVNRSPASSRSLARISRTSDTPSTRWPSSVHSASERGESVEADLMDLFGDADPSWCGAGRPLRRRRLRQARSGSRPCRRAGASGSQVVQARQQPTHALAARQRRRCRPGCACVAASSLLPGSATATKGSAARSLARWPRSDRWPGVGRPGWRPGRRRPPGGTDRADRSK